MGSHARSDADQLDLAGGAADFGTGFPRRLRVLLHGLNFWPDLTGVAKYTFEMAEWLARQGHEIVVVTAPPYYPKWEVGEGYRAMAYRREDISDIRVLRCPLFVPGRQTAPMRIAHALSFGASSLPAMLWMVRRLQPDLVWTVAPSLLAAGTALAAARVARVPAWLHVQDLEADAAFALGLVRCKWLERAILPLEARFIRRFDRVSTISAAMLRRLAEKGCAPDRLSLLPNWVDLGQIRPLSAPNRFRTALGIPPADVVALYSGQMGRKQGLSILLKAAEVLAPDPTLHFIIAGDGPDQPALAAAAAGLARVHVLPLQPVELLPDLLNAADVHLLPQVAHAADLVLPSKLSGMMASGRPVIATAEAGTDLAREVAPVGLVTPPGDPDAFAAAIAELAADAPRRRELGRRARDRAAANWDRDVVLARLEAEFFQLAVAHAGGAAPVSASGGDAEVPSGGRILPE